MAVEKDGEQLYPELYLVPEQVVEQERQHPGSQARIANNNLPLIWTQSLVWLGEMLLEGLILPEDIDPCERRGPTTLGADAVLVGLAPDTAAMRQSLVALVALAAGARAAGPTRSGATVIGRRSGSSS